jgi:hypothetical protein
MQVVANIDFCQILRGEKFAFVLIISQGVNKVPEPGCKTQVKIRAVKHWLTRAEQHFDVDAPVRGQMDLLIAEAELRSTRNAVDSNSNWRKGNWRLQLIAFSLAAILVTAGVGRLWWQNESGGNEEKPTRQNNLPSITLTVPPAPVSVVEDKKLTLPARDSEAVAAASVDTMNPTQEVKKTETMTVPQIALSPEEMKRLVQAAGQTLRGRTKQ